MTVRELRAQLKDLPQDALVIYYSGDEEERLAEEVQIKDFEELYFWSDRAKEEFAALANFRFVRLT